MTDYSAFDIHQLDQAYPDALASIEHLTGDPARKRRLADVGAEVFAAELTRELDATFDSGMSLAGWAAIATARLMEAGKAWEEDTEMAWAKVDELTAELGKIADSIAPTVTVKPVSGAVWFLHSLYKDWVKTAHEAQAKVDELTAALAEKDAVIDAAKRVTATWRFHACIPTADLELTIGEEERKLAEAVDSLPTEIAPNGCDDCSVEPGERHRYFRCPGNGKALLRAEVAR